MTSASTAVMATLIHTSIGPSSASMRSAARSTASASATSAGATQARRPAARTSWAAAWSRSSPRAMSPTSAPRCASSRTVARPTPAEAPVTATTFPCSDMGHAYPSRRAGSVNRMEGGIALLLLLIIAVVAVGIAVAMYLTGGALWTGKTSPKGDKTERGGQGRFRPEHKQVTSPTIENTEVVGAPETHERDG